MVAHSNGQCLAEIAAGPERRDGRCGSGVVLHHQPRVHDVLENVPERDSDNSRQQMTTSPTGATTSATSIITSAVHNLCQAPVTHPVTCPQV